jgi:hypothetical protein
MVNAKRHDVTKEAAMRVSSPLLLLLVALLCTALVAAPQPPPCNPPVTGCFGVPYQHQNNGPHQWPGEIWLYEMHERFNAIHMTVIPTPGPLQGKILAWDYGKPDQFRNSPGVQRWSIIDPSLHWSHPDAFWNFTWEVPNTNGKKNDIACAGFTWLPDGRLLVAGGTEKYLSNGLNPETKGPIIGARLCYTFEPALWNPSNPNLMWVSHGLLTKKRYYPSVLLGSDRWVYIMRGNTDDSDPNNIFVRDDFEMWRRVDEFGQGEGLQLINRPGPDPSLETEYGVILVYSRGQLVSTGELFHAGMEPQAKASLPPLNPLDPWPWTTRGLSALTNRFYGTAVRFPNIDAKHTDAYVILGGQEFVPGAEDPAALAVWGSVQICKASASDPTRGFHDTPQGQLWTPIAPGSGSLPDMLIRRVYLNVVVMPDATLLVIGGTSTPEGVFPAHYAFQAERLKGGQWEPLAFMTTNRRYHHVALLLPSGKVLVAGGEGAAFDYELYDPPYMFKLRPSLLSAPAEVNYGATYEAYFSLPTGAALGQIVLMRPGAVTHHFDGDQRYHKLEFEPPLVNGGAALFDIPTNPNLLPPGYYLMYVVTADGVPSNARWLRVVGQ